MNCHPHTMTFKPSILNVCIMICNELVAHELTKCISLQRPNHHTRRGQSLLIITVCAWNEEISPFLFPSHSKKYIPCSLFLSLNNFSFMKKKSQLGWHPILGASENFNEKKRNEKAVRRPKRALETQMLGDMPKSQERVTTKIKWVYPRSEYTLEKQWKKEKGQIKEKQQKKRWRTQRVELLIAILSIWNLETLFEPSESFSFIARNHI